jgi:retinol dehydrogenase 12
MYPQPFGGITPLYAGTSPELKKEDSGNYFVPWARVAEPLKGSQDAALGSKLWDFLEEQVKEAEQH